MEKVPVEEVSCRIHNMQTTSTLVLPFATKYSVTYLIFNERKRRMIHPPLCHMYIVLLFGSLKKIHQLIFSASYTLGGACNPKKDN